MRSYYEKLVEEQGKEAADQYMRNLRAKRKVNVGGGFNNPTVRAKALEKRRQGGKPKNGDTAADSGLH